MSVYLSATAKCLQRRQERDTAQLRGAGAAPATVAVLSWEALSGCAGPAWAAQPQTQLWACTVQVWASPVLAGKPPVSTGLGEQRETGAWCLCSDTSLFLFSLSLSISLFLFSFSLFPFIFLFFFLSLHFPFSFLFPFSPLFHFPLLSSFFLFPLFPSLIFFLLFPTAVKKTTLTHHKCLDSFFHGSHPSCGQHHTTRRRCYYMGNILLSPAWRSQSCFCWLYFPFRMRPLCWPGYYLHNGAHNHLRRKSFPFTGTGDLFIAFIYIYTFLKAVH